MRSRPSNDAAQARTTLSRPIQGKARTSSTSTAAFHTTRRKMPDRGPFLEGAHHAVLPARDDLGRVSLWMP